MNGISDLKSKIASLEAKLKIAIEALEEQECECQKEYKITCSAHEALSKINEGEKK